MAIRERRTDRLESAQSNLRRAEGLRRTAAALESGQSKQTCRALAARADVAQFYYRQGPRSIALQATARCQPTPGRDRAKKGYRKKRTEPQYCQTPPFAKLVPSSSLTFVPPDQRRRRCAPWSSCLDLRERIAALNCTVAKCVPHQIREHLPCAPSSQQARMRLLIYIALFLLLAAPHEAHGIDPEHRLCCILTSASGYSPQRLYSPASPATALLPKLEL